MKSCYKIHSTPKSDISFTFHFVNNRWLCGFPGTSQAESAKMYIPWHGAHPNLQWLLRAPTLSRAGIRLQFSHTGHVSQQVPHRVSRQEFWEAALLLGATAVGGGG